MLLGQPGMGKSTALKAEALALAARASVGGDLVLRVDLGSTRREQVLAERIFGSPEYTTWAAGDGTPHVFLDSLDEAVLRLGVVADLILEGLEKADVSCLALRVTCRTADRLLDFETRLKDLWGSDSSASSSWRHCNAKTYDKLPPTMATIRTSSLLPSSTATSLRLRSSPSR